MALFWETSLIHKHYTIDGELKLAVAALAVDSTREHNLYLIRSSPARTLVEVWVKGSKYSSVSKMFHLGFLSLQVSNCQIKGECLGGTRGTNNN